MTTGLSEIWGLEAGGGATHHWYSECHCIEGEGGQAHDDANHPDGVSESTEMEE